MFFLTGRPRRHQPAGTLANLHGRRLRRRSTTTCILKDQRADAAVADELRAGLHDDAVQVAHAPAHRVDLGYDIVANFGDQFSDLNGGFADRTFKMPNPMYFLP